MTKTDQMTAQLAAADTAQAPATGQAALPGPDHAPAVLPKPDHVELFGYRIPVWDSDLSFGEMALAYEAVQGGRDIQDMGFIMDFLAEAITNRCELDTPLTAYDLRRKRVNPAELMTAFQALFAPFLAKAADSKNAVTAEATAAP